ncbi:Acetyltransferase (isoleucine patch superfamily) [Anaerovirgula multivorans]|uniref:Acetyltransferase (Isoleucine patch superfamily) n=1 Tax=Anaerovirgula multivorans TaxID=312168 RepID=A0A239EGH8_9FIRM|nr:WxcM-like domain-containing protein [Anaerovirgula multivorans]SNS43659.1 Acetyltransferase (isoleucine patch superfamily) [Anaerovirgula multivorans]
MEVKLFNFKEIGDKRGTLTPIEASKDIPFEIRRVYYMYGTVENARRGYHAHKALKQILICINGSCKVLLDDGKEKTIIELSKRHQGLYIGEYMWREMYDFSKDAVLMVLASDYYDETDYIRDYEIFLTILKDNCQNIDVFIHPKAIVESSNIGSKTKIWAYSHVLSKAVIGKNCNICDHTFIENDVIIGDNVTVKSGVYIWDGVKISNNVFIGPNATFTNDSRPRSKQYPEKFKETIIKEGASIGANATIVAGNTIGKYALIGAGAVVTKNIPDYTMWYGNPAKFKGYICSCGEQLESDFRCPRCKVEHPIKGDIGENENICEIERKAQ